MSTWPPVIPPATRVDDTAQKTAHPADHNQMAAALTQIVGKVTDGSLTGAQGPQGFPGDTGPPGPQGEPGGPIPPGGTTGQVATKQSAADGDVIWANNPGMNYRGVYDYTKDYAVNDVVMATNIGRSYVAVRPVPANSGQTQYFPGIPVATYSGSPPAGPVTTLISAVLTGLMQPGHAYDIEIGGLTVANYAGVMPALATQAIAVNGTPIGNMNLTAEGGRMTMSDAIFQYTPTDLVSTTITITTTTSASPVPTRTGRPLSIRCLDRYYWVPLSVPTFGTTAAGMPGLSDLSDVVAGTVGQIVSSEDASVLAYNSRTAKWQTDAGYARGLIAYRYGNKDGIALSLYPTMVQGFLLSGVPMWAGRMYKVTYVVRAFKTAPGGAIRIMWGAGTSVGVNTAGLDTYAKAESDWGSYVGAVMCTASSNGNYNIAIDLCYIGTGNPAIFHTNIGGYIMVEDIGINRGQQPDG